MTHTKAKVPLSVTHPDIASEWHPEKNGSVTPEQVVAGSNKKVWWICPEGPDHEWQATKVQGLYVGMAARCVLAGRGTSVFCRGTV